MYRISDQIVHPMHGAGVIEDIVEKNISGEKRDYYVLRLSTGSVTVMLPVNACDSIGIRTVMSAAEAEAFLAILPEIPVEDDSNWNRRYRENMDKIKSGDLKAVACVIKSLMAREARKPLSTGERKMLTSAKQILVSELMLATGRTAPEIEAEIRRSISE